MNKYQSKGISIKGKMLKNNSKKAMMSSLLSSRQQILQLLQLSSSSSSSSRLNMVLTLVFCIALANVTAVAVSLPTAEAQQLPPGLVEVTAKQLDKTTLIEFKNKVRQDIEQIRIWSDREVIESFKSEDGWTVEKNSVGVVIFTTENPIKQNQIVKVGLKTDQISSGINWKVLALDGTQIGIGTVIPTDITKIPEPIAPVPPSTTEIPENDTLVDPGLDPITPPPPPPPPPTPIPPEPPVQKDTINEASLFRIIPEKPKVGDSIRVAGEDFESKRELEFYINDDLAKTFKTNSEGEFVITSKIPEYMSPERVEFTIKDEFANEKNISIRIDNIQNRMNSTKDIESVLSIVGLPEVIHPGQKIKVRGTAHADTTITIQIVGPNQNAVTAEPTQVGSDGKWSYETIIPPDTPYGEYSAIVSDGIESKDIKWRVESSKIIKIQPVKLKYEPGDQVKFNGTAIPNEKIELIFEDPKGIEITTEIKTTDSAGRVEFAYQTERSIHEGTYTLLARQQDHTEITLVGIGQLPGEYIAAKMDKTNYIKSENATIRIEGPASSTVSIVVVDPSNKEIFADNQVILQADGTIEYKLDLEKYGTGIYTAVISRGITKTSEVFSVGLSTGSGEIKVRTVKDLYKVGDSILILGETNKNVLIRIQLIDPNGTVIKQKETFSDKDGKITDETFRIPSDATDGKWIIRIASGSNFALAEIEVSSTHQVGMMATFEGIQETVGTGKSVKVKVVGAKTTVNIKVFDSTNSTFGSELSQPVSSAGESHILWPIPKDSAPGTYTLVASDAFNTARVQFTLG